MITIFLLYLGAYSTLKVYLWYFIFTFLGDCIWTSIIFEGITNIYKAKNFTNKSNK